MNSKNFLFAFLALIFTLTIFPFPVSATTYQLIPNGTWVDTSEFFVSCAGNTTTPPNQPTSCGYKSGDSFDVGSGSAGVYRLSAGASPSMTATALNFKWKSGGSLCYELTRGYSSAQKLRAGITVLGGASLVKTYYAGEGVGLTSDCAIDTTFSPNDVNMTFILVNDTSTGGSYGNVDYFTYFDYPAIWGSALRETTASIASTAHIDTNTAGDSQKILCASLANLSTDSTTQSISNGSFENGMAGWSVNIPTSARIDHSNVVSSFAIDGNKSFSVAFTGTTAGMKFNLRPYDYTNYPADANVCFDYSTASGVAGTTNTIYIKDATTDANIALVSLPTASANSGTLCGVISTGGFYIQFERTSGTTNVNMYIDDFTIKNDKYVSTAQNICSITGYSDNPVCSFTNNFPVGSNTVYCQLENSAGELSNLKSTTFTSASNLAGTATISPSSANTDSTLTGTINVSGVLSNSDVVADYAWKYTTDNIIFTTYQTGTATKISNSYFTVPSVSGVLSAGKYWRLDTNIADNYYSASTTASSSTVYIQYGQNEILFTPIQNVSSGIIGANGLAMTGNDNTNDIIYSVQNLTTDAIILPMNFSNSAKISKQYFVYTSSNGASWTFSDTLTFGATNSTPIQKIWNSSAEKYDYNFSDTLVADEVQYYKLVFQDVARYWEVINLSNDWLNQNPPTNLRDSSGKNFDLFADSNYSNVQSYTVPQFQNLVSGDFTVGYELQFTAYATTAGNLSVGYRLNGSDTVATVAVTTSAKRFSVPIAPTARESNLIIKSTNTSSNTFYLTDYAIVPRSYFVGQLEVKNRDYTNLQAILRNGVSSQYVLEGEPVRIQTSFYDTEGDLTEYEVQTLIGSVVVKDQIFSLTGSSAGSVFTVDKLIDGVIDLNGIGGELTTSDSLRSITYKVILHNSSDENVSEQYKTVSILQYPYFPNDLRMQAEVLNTKLGTNPKVRVSLNQRVAQNFLGLVFAFYDGSHSVSSPNYSKTIYTNQLGCTTVTSCAKEINFDEYVWEGTTTTNFTVQVTALLSTENKNYTDAFANVTKHVVVTPSSYSVGQLIQYYERRYALLGTPYKSSEKVPLVLGLNDDSGKNLSNYVSPYFTLGIDSTGDLIIDSNYVTKFYPDVFAYDETTGNNYWLWNQYLYDDSGNLLPDGNNVFFHAVVVDKRNTQGGETHIGFTPRCVKYPFDLNAPDANYLKGSVDFFGYVKFQYDLQWLYTGVGSVVGTFGLNGCQTYPSSIITWDGNYITINDSYTPSAKQNQSLYCGQKYDNNTVIDQLGDDFECILFLKEDEEAIDGIHVQIGNENSDFSISNENKQYIDFTIPQSDILFVDLSQLIRNWNTTGSPQDMRTAWDVLSRFSEDTMHTFSTPLTPSDVSSRYGLRWSQAIGGDANFNLYEDFNNSQFNKVVMFKVSGLSVINAQDYLTSEELNSFDLTRFLSYARENNLNVNPKKAKITIYTNSSKPYKTIETTAPMIINESASTPQQVISADGNVVITTIPAQLGFHVISTMSSANQTKNSRLIANLLFNSIIKFNPKNNGVGGLQGTTDVINGFLFGKDASGKSNGLFNAPLTFISNPLNIVLIIIIVAFALVLTLMARNISNYFQKG